MPEMPDVVSGEIIESEWGNDIRDRTIQRYANVAERTSLNATPDAGDFSFLEDTGIVSVYYAGSWRNILYNEIQHGAAMGLDVTVADGFSTMVSDTFTPPATWLTYSLSAWGTVAFQIGATGGGGTQARLNIGGSIGPTASITATTALGVAYQVNGVSGAVNVVIQARKTLPAAILEADTAVAWVATRTT